MANYSNVNFIKHLLTISEKFIDDERLSPLHISLYYAVFQSWNLSKFRNPISVSRDELMRASKIGSANTYTKCLKELDAWQYIKYFPSFNPHKGSKIYLYNFNKTTDNAIDISTNKSADKTSEEGSVKAPIPSINNSNNTNSLNNVNTHASKSRKNSEKNNPSASRAERKKVAQKKESENKTSLTGREREGQPLLEQVQNYFITNNWQPIEAEKFFNYYQSNGWLIGGKTKMKNWKAAANNWVLNASKFSTSVTSSAVEKRPNNLNATTNKNYNEPL